jgi:hypothetical protein
VPGIREIPFLQVMSGYKNGKSHFVGLSYIASGQMGLIATVPKRISILCRWQFLVVVGTLFISHCCVCIVTFRFSGFAYIMFGMSK